MFRCWGVRNILDLYVDGRLSAARETQVRAHLDDCAACRLQAKPMLGIRALLKRSGGPQVPAGLAEAILKRLEAEPESAAAEAAEPWAWRLSPAQAAAMVYLALLAAGNAGPGLPSQALLAEPPQKEARP